MKGGDGHAYPCHEAYVVYASVLHDVVDGAEMLVTLVSLKGLIYELIEYGNGT